MASLTIRRLDDALKERLRRRAAAHGRSMEDELRAMLRDMPDDASLSSPAAKPTAPVAAAEGARGDASARTGAPRALLIIGGGIAAYKSLDLIRRLRERGFAVRTILTDAAQRFVTPLAAGALSGEKAFTDLFDPAGEFDVGHIRMARDCAVVIVAPATADLMARMAHGLADDLATAVLLATDRKILVAPAMNPSMWKHPATQRNVAQLRASNVAFVGPNSGEMAESGEAGTGRMAEPVDIAEAARRLLRGGGPLAGRHVLVTSGPTHEPIDPVRYIANRSSGRQGHAIARAAAEAGAQVTLISGPVTIADPPGVTVLHVESAREMLHAVDKALPADVAIFTAAVADWRVDREGNQKIKKSGAPPALSLVENPDILATIAQRSIARPTLVVGFAAETEKVVAHAIDKRRRKGCDWIVANDVSPESGVMGGETNAVHLITAAGVENWPRQSKDAVAQSLIARIGAFFAEPGKAGA